MKYAKTALVLIFALAVTLSLFGCFGEKYNVDYDGKKDSFKGAKDSYRAGETVELYFMPATDTDYHFYIDYKEISPLYDSENGFYIKFEMPEHDVKLSVSSKNSMIAPEPTFSKQTTLEFHSFDGGGPEYDIVAEDDTLFSVTSERDYGKRNHEEIDGAGYDVIFTFTGLKAGETTFTVNEYSPIDGSTWKTLYAITVNDNLEVSIEKLYDISEDETDEVVDETTEQQG